MPGSLPGGSHTKLRILVADDHEVVRRGLCAMLAAHDGWEVCAEAVDGREAVEKTAELKPDIVVIDVGMPNLNGLTATLEIVKANPEQKVIILTVTDAEQVVEEALRAGARGFVLKSDAAKDLVTAVEALQQNKNFFTPRVNAMLVSAFANGRRVEKRDAPIPHLTQREREVVQLAAEGKSSKEIAVALGLSTKTAETHRSNVMRKLGLHSISELTLYAIRNQIIQV